MQINEKYYKILKIDNTASLDEIRSSFKASCEDCYFLYPKRLKDLTKAYLIVTKGVQKNVNKEFNNWLEEYIRTYYNYYMVKYREDTSFRTITNEHLFRLNIKYLMICLEESLDKSNKTKLKK